MRRPGLAETMSQYLIEEIAANPRITVTGNSRIAAGGGPAGLEYLDVENLQDGTISRIPAGGLFLLLGADPNCQWLPDQIARDSAGYILTGRATPQETWLGRTPPDDLATTVPGIFAVGDVRAGSMKRVASAVGEGATVVPMIHHWLSEPAAR